MSLRKSSRRRKGSKSEVLPKPNARRRCTPAPSRAGLDLMSRMTGRRDMLTSPRSRNVQDAAALLIAFLQLEGHGEVIGEPERHRRQRLSKTHGLCPRL